MFKISWSADEEFVISRVLSLRTINITLNEGELYNFVWNFTTNNSLLDDENAFIHASSEDRTIVGFNILNYSEPVKEAKYTSSNGTIVIPLQGGHLGVTNVNIMLPASVNNNLTMIPCAVLQIKVLRQKTLLDALTVFLLGPLVLINKCAFGAKIETGVLWRVLTRPIELLVCLFVQFVLMPLMAIGLGYFCNLNQVMALALFVAAACPGGGGGYVFSYLIDGDITLAITASLMSTLFAMGAMPAVIGLYTFLSAVPSEIRIPYVDIVLMLMAIAIPISTGMFFRKKWPEYAAKFVVIIKPLSLLIIAGGLIIVIFTSRYVLYGPKIGMLLAILLPLCTFIVALALSLCLSFSWPLSKAVSLESGLKNTVLGIAVIELSFPQPEADLASILIIMITIGHTVTALIWYMLYLIKSKCDERRKLNEDNYKALAKPDSEETTMFL